jgi:cell division protein ZapA (FtsZ GTPase activity inhibitor)
LEQLITITLFGKPYNFKVESDILKAQEVADFLVEEVSRVESQQTHKSSEVAKVAILISAALNIANEHIELRKNHTDLLKNISEKSTSLIRVLDAHMQ